MEVEEEERWVKVEVVVEEEEEAEEEEDEDEDEEDEEDEEVWLVPPDADQPDVVALHTRGRCASRCGYSGGSGDEDAATYCDTDAPSGLSCLSSDEERDDSEEDDDW